jgi:hypothetical protein
MEKIDLYTKVRNTITTNNSLNENWFSWIYIILIWLSIFPTVLLFQLFFNLFSIWLTPMGVICFLPILIMLYFGLFLVFLLFNSKLLLILINLIHHPKEGIFKRNFRDKDYLFFILRKTIKKFILKAYNYFPLPWVKIFALKLCNIKVSYNTGLLDSYIDSDFVEIGENTILGEGSVIMSSMIFNDFILLKKVILKEGSTIGAFSVISPGTIVGEGAILGMGSYTQINQYLEPNFIHIGKPAKKKKKIEYKSNFNKK